MTTPILIFMDWGKIIHVHVDMSNRDLGVVLSYPGERDINHPIEFAGRKLSTKQNYYITIEQDGLAMVFAV